MEIALRALTSNPAKILKLRNKCRIERGFDADLNLLMKKTLDDDTVIINGIELDISNEKFDFRRNL